MEACCWGWESRDRIRWLLSSLLAYQNCRFGSFAYLLHLRAFSKPQKYLNIPMLQLHPYLRTMVPLRFQQFSAHQILDDWTLLGQFVNLLLKDEVVFWYPIIMYIFPRMSIVSTPSTYSLRLLKACPLVTHPHSPWRVNGKCTTFLTQKLYKILLTLFEYISQKSISVSRGTLSQLCQKNKFSGCVLNQTYYFACNNTFI